jgi:ubiquinone/menaquinone biosynthesis C-methylase UbiE
MSKYIEYWQKAVPWTFRGEGLTYEQKRKMRYELQDYMIQAIGFESYRSKIVVELGCGGGIDSAEFARNGAEVVSIDFTRTAVEATKSTLEEAGVIHQNIIQADLHNLPLRDSIADCIYSFGVLHHIPDVENVISEVVRIAKERSDVICMLYNRESILYAYSILFLHRNEGVNDEQRLIGLYSERILGCPYTKAYTKEEAVSLFSRYFNEISAKVYYNVVDLPGKRKFKLNIPDEYQLGWHIIVKCRGKKYTALSINNIS